MGDTVKTKTRTNEDGIKERQCTKCNEWLEETDINFYYKNKKEPQKGFIPECKKCLIKRAFNITKQNPERRKQYLKKANAKDKRKSNLRRWAQERRDNGVQYKYLKTSGKSAIYNKIRKLKNHTMTEKEWEYCLSYFGYCCAYCGMTLEEHKKEFKQQLHKEHVVHNGENDLSNCVPSCKTCNSCKHDFEFNKWYNESNPEYIKQRYEKIIKWINGDYKATKE